MKLRLRRLEGVELSGTYPEPWFLESHSLMRWTYRALLGRPMDNVIRTNATFWRDATNGYPSRWLRLAGWKRALTRLAVMYLLPLMSALALMWALGYEQLVLTVLTAHVLMAWLLIAPVLTYKLIRAHGITLLLPTRVSTASSEHAEPIAVWVWERRVLIHGRREWEREKLLPLARSLVAQLQLPHTRAHRSEVSEWLTVPRNYREPGSSVSIRLPLNFTTTTDAARKRLVLTAAERLGMRDPVARWELEGSNPRLLLSAPVLPPTMVSMSDVLPVLTATPEYTFVLGKVGNETFSVSLKEDSPHIAVSAGSGAGKSELIKLLVMQALHWGWCVIILDWKEESQEWAEGLPGVRYVRDIENLHDMCIELGEEVEWRKANRHAPRPKTLVISEEWGITAPLLSDYWLAYRAHLEPVDRQRTPVKSPAAVAMMKLNFTGRSLGMHQALVAQRFSARVTNGNADLRESFSVVLMSRWKSQTWKMLAPDVKPMPRKITQPGRWAAITGDECAIFQAILATDEEAREWSLAGEPNPASPWSERYAPVGSQHAEANVMGSNTLGKQLRPVNTGQNPDSPVLDYLEGEVVPSVKLMKLKDIAETLDYLGITKAILQKAARDDAQGDSDFPPVEGGSQFNGYLYDLHKVKEWAQRKRAAEAVRAKK